MGFNESLPRDCVLDRLQAMVLQEEESYNYLSYFPEMSIEELERQCLLNASWREKICQWTYNVVDHFDLPREVVAISLDYFDRYLATRGNECTGNMALLASLTTLHIAIKIHSEKNIKVSTLASLSRGQFGPQNIEQMEWELMNALGFKLHPPTLFAFVSHLLLLFPNDVHHSVRKDLFEVAIYMAELSVCDSFFVRYSASTVAMAALINVIDDLPTNRLSLRSRDAFWTLLTTNVKGFNSADITTARERLRIMFSSTNSTHTSTPNHTSQSQDQQVQHSHLSVTTSPTSTTEMHMEEATSVASSSCAESKFHTRVADQYRYSSSPTTSQAPASPMDYSRARITASPIITTMR